MDIYQAIVQLVIEKEELEIDLCLLQNQET